MQAESIAHQRMRRSLSPAAKYPAFSGPGIVWQTMPDLAAVASVMHQMIHGFVVAAAESLAIVMSRTCLNMRMTELITVIHVWLAVVVEVLASSFDSIVEALTLDIAKLLRWCIPSTRPLIITARLFLWLGHDKARGSQRECEYWKCKSIELHGPIPPCYCTPFDQMTEFDVLLY
jgi:hypothetical protein